MTIEIKMTAGGLVLLVASCCATTLMSWAFGYVEGKEDGRDEAYLEEAKAKIQELADKYL